MLITHSGCNFCWYDRMDPKGTSPNLHWTVGTLSSIAGRRSISGAACCKLAWWFPVYRVSSARIIQCSFDCLWWGSTFDVKYFGIASYSHILGCFPGLCSPLGTWNVCGSDDFATSSGSAFTPLFLKWAIVYRRPAMWPQAWLNPTGQ